MTVLARKVSQKPLSILTSDLLWWNLSGDYFAGGIAGMDYHFEKGKFTEAELENAIIALFKQQGLYTHVHGESIHREYDDILLTDDLCSFLANKSSQAY